MLKKSKTDQQPSAMEDTDSTATFRENPQVNAKIDDYIKNNPKRWEYIQSMPRERMERAMVLHEVQKNEQREKLDKGILRRLDKDPELKQTCENLVKNLPEGEREKAMISIARNITMRQSRAQSQSQGGQKI